ELLKNMALNRGQIIVFGMTWVIYASSYLLRKPLGVIKTDLEAYYGLTPTELGWLDTAFLLPYAFVAIMFGNLGDKYGNRNILVVSLLAMSFSMGSFGFWDSPKVFAVLLFINGGAQAQLYCNIARFLTSWFDSSQKTTMFGMWGTAPFAGGIIGTAVAVELQRRFSGDLKMMFLVPCVWIFFLAIATHFFLKFPHECGMESPDPEKQQLKEDEPTAVQPKKALNFIETWKIKMVPELCWSMFGAKLVRYCLYMWLPMYLAKALKYDKGYAGMFSTTFEIGGVFGSFCNGFYINRLMGGRSYLGVFVAFATSGLSLYLFELTSTWSVFFNFIFLFMAGAANCGPDLVVSGSLATEVAKAANAESAVAGLVNGFGSLGTIIEGPFIAFVMTQFGWSGAFYSMVFLSLGASLAVGKAALAEYRK
uniref:Major facilitator superfamily (MFS) profile domain-containing protein n=2 Tax=Clytia hemisphaerica TaxID=252671 RepID=A0A7M5X7B9_9CNID